MWMADETESGDEGWDRALIAATDDEYIEEKYV